MLQTEGARSGGVDVIGCHNIGGGQAGGGYAAGDVGVVAVQGVGDGLPGEGCEIKERAYEKIWEIGVEWDGGGYGGWQRRSRVWQRGRGQEDW